MDTPKLEAQLVAGEDINLDPNQPTTPVFDYQQADPNAERPEAQWGNQLTALNRRSEKDPHFFGSVKINGLWYQQATWINMKDGVQNLQTAFTLMNTEQAEKAEQREAEYQAKRKAAAAPLSAPPVNKLAQELEGEQKSDKVNADDPL